MKWALAQMPKYIEKSFKQQNKTCRRLTCKSHMFTLMTNLVRGGLV